MSITTASLVYTIKVQSLFFLIRTHNQRPVIQKWRVAPPSNRRPVCLFPAFCTDHSADSDGSVRAAMRNKISSATCRAPAWMRPLTQALTSDGRQGSLVTGVTSFCDWVHASWAVCYLWPPVAVSWPLVLRQSKAPRVNQLIVMPVIEGHCSVTMCHSTKVSRSPAEDEWPNLQRI